MNEGKKDRRDPIRTIKTKNPVAKAHQTVGTGSGAHKDKKRAMKQGEVKHKHAEISEMTDAEVAKLRKDAEEYATKQMLKPKEKEAPAKKKSFMAQVGDKIIGGVKGAAKGFSGNESYEAYLAHQLKESIRACQVCGQTPCNCTHLVSEDFDSPEYNDEAGMADNNLETLKRAVDGIDDVINTGDNLPEWCQEKIAVAKSMLVTVWDYMLSEKDSEQSTAEGWSDAMVARRTGQPRTPYSVYIKGKKWKDFSNDDHARSVMDKLKAKFKADGRDPETITIAPTDISEGQTALEKFRKASAEREKKHNDAEKEMNARHARGEEDMKGSIDRLEKHVNTKEGLRDPKDNPCWKGYKPVGTKKKSGKTVPNCVPKEGWTHDSLAAELFETENTYEDRLTNLLNKRLGQ
jgi:hypothetical protein